MTALLATSGPVALLVAGLVVAVGALVQGTVGFGLALVAAPLPAILDPGRVSVPSRAARRGEGALRQ